MFGEQVDMSLNDNLGDFWAGSLDLQNQLNGINYLGSPDDQAFMAQDGGSLVHKNQNDGTMHVGHAFQQVFDAPQYPLDGATDFRLQSGQAFEGHRNQINGARNFGPHYEQAFQHNLNQINGTLVEVPRLSQSALSKKHSRNLDDKEEQESRKNKRAKVTDDVFGAETLEGKTAEEVESRETKGKTAAAAKKSREKKKLTTSQLLQRLRDLETANDALRKDTGTQAAELATLVQTAEQHNHYCSDQHIDVEGPMASLNEARSILSTVRR